VDSLFFNLLKPENLLEICKKCWISKEFSSVGLGGSLFFQRKNQCIRLLGYMNPSPKFSKKKP
jgi:hypothetical protein